jgi:hypothetical protein
MASKILGKAHGRASVGSNRGIAPVHQVGLWTLLTKVIEKLAVRIKWMIDLEELETGRRRVSH